MRREHGPRPPAWCRCPPGIPTARTARARAAGAAPPRAARADRAARRWGAMVAIRAQNREGTRLERRDRRPGGPAPSRATSTARMPAASAPAMSVSGESPDEQRLGRLDRRQRQPGPERLGRRLGPPHLGRGDHAVDQLAEARPGASAAGSERSQLLTTTTRAPGGAHRRQRRGGVGERREHQRAEHGRPHRGTLQPVDAERVVQHGRAVVAQRLQPGLVAAAHVVARGSSRSPPRTRARRPRRPRRRRWRAPARPAAAAPAARAAPGSRARRTGRPGSPVTSHGVPAAVQEIDMDVDFLAPHPVFHAMKYQAAYWAVKRPRPSDDAAATRAVLPRSAHTAPIHMKIGNSTTRKRGRLISGCGATG